jgi:hypothetical protein
MANRILDICVAQTDAANLELSRHGLTIRLHCKDQTYLGYCANRIYQAGPAFAANQKTIDIHVVSPDCSPLPAPPVWQREGYASRALENVLLQTPIRVSYFHDLDLWHIFDHQRAVGVQWMASKDAYPPWEPAAPLRIFMHWALSSPESRLVHAGTLGINGKAVLFAGRGGAGKSSTVVAGIMHGLQSAGDDYVHVCAENGTFNAYPIFSTLKQDAAGLARSGLTQITEHKSANWQNKFEFTAEDIGGQPLTGPLNLRALFAPVIGNQKGTVILPISKSKAMLALAPSALFQMPGERDSGVAFFANLVRNLPCYEIILGQNPNEIVSCLVDFLEQQ